MEKNNNFQSFKLIFGVHFGVHLDVHIKSICCIFLKNFFYLILYLLFYSIKIFTKKIAVQKKCSGFIKLGVIRYLSRLKIRKNLFFRFKLELWTIVLNQNIF